MDHSDKPCGFANACFISYKHPPQDLLPSVKHFWLEFIEELHANLERYLGSRIRIYYDDKLRIRSGRPIRRSSRASSAVAFA